MATAPLWKANGVAASGTGAISVPWPTGHAAGDLALLFVNTSGEDPPSTPPGWNDHSFLFTGTPATTDATYLAIYWAVASSGTMANAAVPDSGNHTLGVTVTFTGCYNADPFEASTGGISSSLVSSDTLTSVTTLSNNAMVVAVTSTGQESVKSGWTMAGLASFTARASGTTTSGLDGGVACATGIKVTAGATGTGSVTYSIASKSVYRTLSLRPNNFDNFITAPGISSAVAFGTALVGGGAVTIISTLPAGFVDIAYSKQLQATGGNGTYTWSVSSGTLPPGLTLTSGGLLSGTPTTAGSYAFTIRATDTASSFGSLVVSSFSVTVLGIDDAFDVVLYTGNGEATRALTSTVDLSGGGYICVYNRSGSGAPGTYMSANGSSVYRSTGFAAIALTSDAVFGNGTFTLNSNNTNGVLYMACVVRKHPLICDVVILTGDGTANRAVPHSLVESPGFIGMEGTGYGWYTGHTSDVYTQYGSGVQYKQAATGIWGSTAHTATNFYIGGSTNSNGVLESFVLFPSVSKYLKVGTYTGDGTNDRSSAMQVGGPVQWLLSLSSVSGALTYFEALDGNDFVGNDDRVTANSGAIFSGANDISGGSSGITVVSASALNQNAASYSYVAFGRTFLYPVQSLTATSISGAEAFGSPTLTQSFSLVHDMYSRMFIGDATTATFTISAGVSPYTMVLQSGTLPPGMVISSSGPDVKLLSGTPTTAGDYTFTLRFTDSAGVPKTDDKVYTVLVRQHAYIKDKFDAHVMTGDGVSSSRTIPTTLDLSAGGVVLHFRDANFTDPNAFMFDGTNVYSRDNVTGVVTVNPAGVTFANGSFTTPVHYPGGGAGWPTNYNGAQSLFMMFAKKPGFCDIVVSTGDGTSNRALSHNLGYKPEVIIPLGFRTSMWMNGFPNNAYYSHSNGAGGRLAGDGRFGTSEPTTTQFYVGGTLNSTTGEGPTYAFMVLGPGGTGADAIVATGTYVGNASSPREGAIAPGWPVEFLWNTYRTISTCHIHAGNSGTNTTRSYAGVDDNWQFDSGQHLTTNDFYDNAPNGMSIRTSGFNDNGVSFDYFVIRQGAIDQTITPTGIASVEALGSHTVTINVAAQNLVPTGIASVGAYGAHTVTTLTALVAPSIATAETLGAHTLTTFTPLSATGIASTEATGAHAVTTLTALTATGIASAGAYGAHTLTPGAVALTATGIASAGAYGAHTLTPGAVALTATGIASAGAYGAHTLTATYSIVAPSIATAEAFGSHAVSGAATALAAPAIGSAEAFGSHTLTPGTAPLTATGIAPAEAMGSHTLTSLVTLAATGIASAEAVGTHTLTPGASPLTAAGIASGGAYGSHTLSSIVTLTASAISSNETFGTHVLTPGSVALTAIAIGTSEALGSHTLAPGASPLVAPSISSEEATGAHTLTSSYTIQHTSIASDEAFGSGSVTTLTTLVASSIAGGEAFGSHVATVGAISLQPAAIGSDEAFGSATVQPGAVSIQPAGIATAESFGAATLTSITTLQVTGIASEFASGVATVSLRLSAPSIATDEQLGTHQLMPGEVVLSATGIASDFAAGSHLAALVLVLVPTSIPSVEVLGTPSISMRVYAPSVVSDEAFGVPSASMLLRAASIASAEAVGTPALTSTYLINQTSIGTAEAIGTHVLSAGVVTLYAQTIAFTGALGSHVMFGGAGRLAPHQNVIRPTPAVPLVVRDEDGDPNILRPGAAIGVALRPGDEVEAVARTSSSVITVNRPNS